MPPALDTFRRALLSGACALAPVGWAVADENRPDDPAEAIRLPSVTVTAAKIEQPLEHVPASLVVIDGHDIDQSGITGMEALAGRVPGLTFQPFGQAGMEAPVMRGQTASIHSYSTSVLMLVDDVPTLMPQGFENNLLDVDHVEVLRGPQSTLYGRNAEAGVIAIHSRPMDMHRRAGVTVDFGNRAQHAVRAYYSGPIIADTLYGSVSGSWLEQDGFIRNLYTHRKDDDRQHDNLNLGLRWTPLAGTDVVMRYVRQHYDDGATWWGISSMPRARVTSGTPSWNHSLGQTASLNIAQRLTDRLQLRSITAYNDYRDRVLQDTDFTPADLLYVGRQNHFRTWSEELRLEGRAGSSDWLLGVYGDQGDQQLRNFMYRRPTFMDYRGRLQTRTLALFNNWTVPLSDDWTLTAGGRIERLSARLAPPGRSRKYSAWHYFSPKLSIQYAFGAASQWYATAGRGVRAGGYNVFVPALDYPSYGPETSWSYETGVKGWVLDRRLRYATALYLTRISDMQVQMQPALGVLYIASAAKAHSKGLELDLDYLLGGGWQLTAGLAWNRTTFDRFLDGRRNYTGRYNSYVPLLDGHLALRYSTPRHWYAQAELNASSRIYLDVANLYARRGYGLINLLAGYRQDAFEIAAYVNNLTAQIYDAVGYSGIYSLYSRPREFGMRVSWRL